MTSSIQLDLFSSLSIKQGIRYDDPDSIRDILTFIDSPVERR